ncbi:hypothetical protein FRC12_007967 [Ceratobasidium sp. 428]|nr:hypothetical protein FRC12_007967 [Ceratobasidium sp. 428]
MHPPASSPPQSGSRRRSRQNPSQRTNHQDSYAYPNDVTYHRVVRELLQPANITGGISKLGPIVAPQSMLHPPTLASENERDSGIEQRANAILHSLPAPWTMPIPKLCEVIFESTRPYEAWIDSITCYREPKGVRHEFLVVKIALSDGRYRWIRLDRAVQNSTNIFRLFSQSSRASAQDEATIHSSYSGDIVRDGEVVQHLDVRVHLLSLHILADLLKIFSSEAEFYTLFQKNCWFLCLVVLENLADLCGIWVSLKHSELGEPARKRISRRFKDLRLQRG